MAAIVSLVLISPILTAQERWLSLEEPRQPELVAALSATPSDLLRTPVNRLACLNPASWFLVPEELTAAAAEQQLRPPRPDLPIGASLPAYLLAAIGLVLGCRSNRSSLPAERQPLAGPAPSAPSLRRWTACCGALALLSFAAALGTNLEFAGFSPYRLLFEHVPFVNRIRSPFRWAALGQIAIVFLCANAWTVLQPAKLLSRLQQFAAPRIAEPLMSARRRWSPWGLVALSLTVALLTVLSFWHTWPATSRLCEVPPSARQSPSDIPDWVRWLREETTPDSSVVHLPFPAGTSPRDYLPTVSEMLSALDHQRPLANGFSGFFPAHYRHLKSLFARSVTAEGLEQLRRLGIDYAIFRTADWQQLRDHDSPAAKWEVVHADRASGVIICRLPPRP